MREVPAPRSKAKSIAAVLLRESQKALSMLVGLIGRFLCVMARFTPGDAGHDLDHVGQELIRLDRRRGQPRATSR